MQTVLLSILAGALRQALFGLSGYMVGNGWITEEQNAQFIGGLALALFSFGWMVYTKYKDRLSLLTAAALPPSTLNEVDQMTKANAPAVSSSSDVVPQLTPTNPEVPR